MLLAVAAWRLRESSRRSLAEGDAERAFALASRAQELHRTRPGEDLVALSGWLRADHPDQRGWEPGASHEAL